MSCSQTYLTISFGFRKPIRKAWLARVNGKCDKGFDSYKHCKKLVKFAVHKIWVGLYVYMYFCIVCLCCLYQRKGLQGFTSLCYKGKIIKYHEIVQHKLKKRIDNVLNHQPRVSRCLFCALVNFLILFISFIAIICNRLQNQSRY